VPPDILGFNGFGRAHMNRTHMNRVVWIAMLAVASIMPLPEGAALAQSPYPQGTDNGFVTYPSTQRRYGTRLRVYRQVLSPNAVRACDSWYELEDRLSGTVLVPRMRCRWIDG
jgi:hypothetical protein